jgi:hypothetical protein
VVEAVTEDAGSDLRERLRPHWPVMVQRIGERWPAFESAVRQRAVLRGLTSEAAIARFAGLCLSFGPGFEDKPEHEWALAVLADERLGEWVKLHQLVLRAESALKRRGGDAPALVAGDSGLLDALDLLRHEADPDAAPLPRRACDIEAVDLRVLEADWRQEMQRTDGTWQRVRVPQPASLRVDLQRPAPPRLCVLSHAPGEGPQTLLQLRQIAHGGCGERHPAVQWLDASGLQRWAGHQARAVSWPVAAMAQLPAPPGYGSALIEQTSPAVHLLKVETCGLRDQGVPMERIETQVWAYPAHQWLFALQRGGALQWDSTAATTSPASPPTQLRLQRDERPIDAPAWTRRFDTELEAALREGLAALLKAWSSTAQQPALQARAELLTGRATLAWGWREGAGGIADDAVLRVLADLDLRCATQLQLLGEIEVGASRTRVRLQAQGEAPLHFELARERNQPPLLDALLPARVSWRCPFTIDADPIANDEAVVCQALGPCSGALVGEAGLRPRSEGSGWQWFVKLGLEPVFAPITLHDPLLGQTQRKLALLPALTLVDWSAG